MLLFSLVTPVYSLYFCIVLFTRFNKLNDDDDDDINSAKSVCIRIGRRFCNSCQNLVTTDGHLLIWADSIRGILVSTF